MAPATLGKPSPSGSRKPGEPGSRSPAAKAADTKRRGLLYRVGAYVVFPLLALAGGELLARATSRAGLASASLLLAAAAALNPILFAYCRPCAERWLPRVLRLLVMPAAVLSALAERSVTSVRQMVAFAMIGTAIVLLSLAWSRSAYGPAIKRED